MLSPSAASENVVIYCAGLRGTQSLSLYVKHQAPAAAWTRVSFNVFHTLQYTGQRVQWSVK